MTPSDLVYYIHQEEVVERKIKEDVGKERKGGNYMRNGSAITSGKNRNIYGRIC